MLCAINVYSEPNSHWWSEKEGVRESAGELTACCCKRERERAGILERTEVGWLFVFFSNSGNGDGGGRAYTDDSSGLASGSTLLCCRVRLSSSLKGLE